VSGWTETTEAHAREQRECVPPIIFQGGFACGEPLRFDAEGRQTYRAFVNVGGTWFESVLAKEDMAPEAAMLRGGIEAQPDAHKAHRESKPEKERGALCSPMHRRSDGSCMQCAYVPSNISK